jgi:hypothetical protein
MDNVDAALLKTALETRLHTSAPLPPPPQSVTASRGVSLLPGKIDFKGSPKT